MEGFNTVNSRKLVTPVESNGRGHCPWKGKHQVSEYFANEPMKGLTTYSPTNTPYAEPISIELKQGSNFYQRDSLDIEFCKLHIKGHTHPSVLPTLLTFTGTTCRIIVAYVDTVKLPTTIVTGPGRMFYADYFASTDYLGAKIHNIYSPKDYDANEDIEVLYDCIYRMMPEQLAAPNVTQENALVLASDLGVKLDVMIDLEGRKAGGLGQLDSPPSFFTNGSIICWFVSDDPNPALTSSFYFTGQFDVYYNTLKD